MGVVRITRANTRWPAVGAWPLALGILWTVLVGVSVLLKPAGSEATLCVFRNVTGLPCPTCGSTRAALSAVQGRPLDAIAFNPFVTVAGALSIGWLAMRVGFRRRIEINLAPRQRTLVWVVIAALLGANWVYVILGNTSDDGRRDQIPSQSLRTDNDSALCAVSCLHAPSTKRPSACSRRRRRRPFAMRTG